MDKKIGVVALLLLSLLLTGCWDAIEIDQRAYVLALGVDKYQQESTDDPEEVPRNRFTFSYIFPSLGAMEDGGPPTIFQASVGPNLFTASRVLATRANKQIFLGHMKVVIVGEDVARDSTYFREILDAIERDRFISRRISLAIAPGKAQEVLQVEPAMEPNVGTFMADIFRAKSRSPRVGHGIIGEILIDLHRWGNTTVPRVIAGDKDIKVAGSAIIKDYRLIGWLGELETRAVMTIRNQAPPGGIIVQYEGHILPVDLIYKQTRLALQENNGQLRMKVKVEAEADVEQFFFDPEQDLLDPEVINKIEDVVAKAIEEEMKVTVEKLQKEFSVDVLGFNNYIHKHHPRLWGEIEDEWEEIFPELDIDINVDCKIRRIGLTK